MNDKEMLQISRLHLLICITLHVCNVSHLWLFATPGIAACQPPLSSTISQSLFKFMSIESVMLSNHLILCCLLLLLPSIFPSISLFQWVGSLHQVAKVLGLSFSISPSNENSRLISFRIDWFDLLAIQGTLKSLLQHHSLIDLKLSYWRWLLWRKQTLYKICRKQRKWEKK